LFENGQQNRDDVSARYHVREAGAVAAQLAIDVLLHLDLPAHVIAYRSAHERFVVSEDFNCSLFVQPVGLTINLGRHRVAKIGSVNFHEAPSRNFFLVRKPQNHPLASGPHLISFIGVLSFLSFYLF
jgi:hypothetical protein